MTNLSESYESMLLCPYGSAGEMALHEAIQEGWEPLVSWICEEGSQHIALRRPDPLDNLVQRIVSERDYRVRRKMIEGAQIRLNEILAKESSTA